MSASNLQFTTRYWKLFNFPEFITRCYIFTSSLDGPGRRGGALQGRAGANRHAHCALHDEAPRLLGPGGHGLAAHHVGSVIGEQQHGLCDAERAAPGTSAGLTRRRPDSAAAASLAVQVADGILRVRRGAARRGSVAAAAQAAGPAPGRRRGFGASATALRRRRPSSQELHVCIVCIEISNLNWSLNTNPIQVCLYSDAIFRIGLYFRIGMYCTCINMYCLLFVLVPFNLVYIAMYYVSIEQMLVLTSIACISLYWYVLYVLLSCLY